MPKFDDVNVGDELPTLTKAPDRAQLVLYCAGSGDFNPLHWDQSFPQAQAIGDNIVHGRMKWSTLGQVVSDWVGGDGWVRSVSCQYRGMDMQVHTEHAFYRPALNSKVPQNWGVSSASEARSETRPADLLCQ